jgi:hypothetical protein
MAADRSIVKLTSVQMQRSVITNRLGIAHLLLWMATTGAVLGFVTSPEAARNDSRVRHSATMERVRDANRALAIAAAPAYGAALAGMVLALWRTVSRKFAFPVQPGHWLLQLVGVIPLAIAAAWCVQRVDRLAFAFCYWLGLVLAALLMAIGSWKSRNSRRWERIFLLWSWGLVLLAASICVAAIFGDGDAWFLWYVVNLAVSIPLVVGVVWALVATGVELFANQQWDIFHWIGVVTFWTVLAHPVLVHVVHSVIAGQPVWLLV